MQAIEQFKEQVLAAARGKRALRIRGGGTKDWYGQGNEGDILDTRGYKGIVDYEPTELVITARCGTPLAEIEAALAERNQMLAFEPPHFGDGATFGGAIAAGLSGPRRANSGAVRDFVLGVKLMDGKGEVLGFGGQVMKNVAGYDVSRLLAGSLGTLGLMLEMSVKVLPRAVSQASLRFDMSEIDAIRKLNEWGGQPLPVSASCWHDGVLTLRLSGARAAVDAAVKSLGGEVMPEDAAFWDGLREQRHRFFAGEGAALASRRFGRHHGTEHPQHGDGGRRPRHAVPRWRQERRRVPAAGPRHRQDPRAHEGGIRSVAHFQSRTDVLNHANQPRRFHQRHARGH
jgi:glycolate oxidase FAD binding subunit